MSERSDALSIQDLSVRRGGSIVVRSVSVEVPRGSLVALLGANGAGKSSLLDAISGTLASTGSVNIDGHSVSSAGASIRARRGLGYIQQGRTVFPDLTVEQNLLVVAPQRELRRAWTLFPELETLRRRRAELLSGGEQQMLMIARAVLTEPRYLMIDELSLGLAPTIVHRLYPVIRQLVTDGMGVLLVEQFADAALKHADVAYVLARGTVTFEGAPDQLRSDSSLLRRAYLGEANAAQEPPRTGKARS
ncbi:MAG: ABC transporter ATP-binding protein [Pseudolysinimonas sp.]